MEKTIARFWKEQSGQDMVEYALLLLLVGLAIAATIRSTGNVAKSTFASAATRVGVAATTDGDNSGNTTNNHTNNNINDNNSSNNTGNGFGGVNGFNSLANNNNNGSGLNNDGSNNNNNNGNNNGNRGE